ncbi:MAG: O-antigen ligase family protein [Acidimicrobiales bacterium]|nr:O-antigen ligase family protein [Acidimicrobiales bacterium]
MTTVQPPRHGIDATPAGPDARRPTIPAWSHPVALKLFLAAIFLVPVQLEIASVREVIGSRLPPGDIFLAAAVLLAPASFRLRRSALGYLPLALPLTLAYGSVVALVLQGHLTTHSLNVKFLGSMVLVVTATVTMAYSRAGFAPLIIRRFLLGVAFWGVVGYIDWRVANIFPWLEHDEVSRFGSLQHDVNNAGALFGVALVISWRYGPRVFRYRWTWATVTVWFAVGLGLTLSRSAYIATGAGIAIVLIVDHVNAEKAMRYAVWVIGITAFLLASGFVDTAVEDFTRRPDTVSSRNSFVDHAVDRWVDSRGLGMGLGTFRDETTFIVHNTGIWLLVEMSVPGIVFFAAMIVVPFQACLRLRRHDHELAMALLAAHTTMIVASVGIEALYQRSWWIIIGMTVLPAAATRRADPVPVPTD